MKIIGLSYEVGYAHGTYVMSGDRSAAVEHGHGRSRQNRRGHRRLGRSDHPRHGLPADVSGGDPNRVEGSGPFSREWSESPCSAWS